MLDILADKVLVALVIRMHGNACVTKHRLWTGRSNFDSLLRAINWVFEVPDASELNLLVVTRHSELRSSFKIFVVYFEIGEGRVEFRAPIHKAIRPIYQSFVMQLREGLAHGG